MQNWSDAKARFSEVSRAMGQVRAVPAAVDASPIARHREQIAS
jgi:hypothetical protein